MAVLQRSDHGGTFQLTATIDLPNITATASTQQVTGVSVPGLLATDTILQVIPPVALDAGLSVPHAWVTAADTVTLRVMNATGGAINPASGTFIFLVARA